MHAGQALYQLSYSPSLHINIYVLLTHNSQLLCCWGDDPAAQGLLRGLAGLWLWTAGSFQEVELHRECH